MGCGCNAKKNTEDEYNADSQDKSIGGPVDSLYGEDCSHGKDAYSDAESPLYDTFISVFAGVVGFYATSVLKVEQSYSKAGIVVASFLLGNVLSKNMKLGKTIAGMRFDMKCKGGE